MLRRVISVRQKTITFRSYGCWDDRNGITTKWVEEQTAQVKSQEKELCKARSLLAKVKYNVPFNQKDVQMLNEQLGLHKENDPDPIWGYNE